MREDIGKRLAAILDAFDARQERAEQRRAEQEQGREKAQHDFLLEDFASKAQETIRPVMQEIADILRTRGYDCSIFAGDQFIPLGKRAYSGPGVALKIRLHGREALHSLEWLQIAFLLNSTTGATFVYQTTCAVGGRSRSRTVAEYYFDEITPDLVEYHILSILERVLAAKKPRTGPAK